MNVRDKIKNGDYAPPPGLYIEDRDAYGLRRVELEEQFRIDALNEVGLGQLPGPTQNDIFTLAWTNAYTSGFGEVLARLEELADIARSAAWDGYINGFVKGHAIGRATQHPLDYSDARAAQEALYPLFEEWLGTVG